MTGSKSRLAHLFGIAGLLATGSLVIAGAGYAQSTFNHPGNILITNQFNNRVIEIGNAGTSSGNSEAVQTTSPLARSSAPMMLSASAVSL